MMQHNPTHTMKIRGWGQNQPIDLLHNVDSHRIEEIFWASIRRHGRSENTSKQKCWNYTYAICTFFSGWLFLKKFLQDDSIIPTKWAVYLDAEVGQKKKSLRVPVPLLESQLYVFHLIESKRVSADTAELVLTGSVVFSNILKNCRWRLQTFGNLSFRQALAPGPPQCNVSDSGVQPRPPPTVKVAPGSGPHSALGRGGAVRADGRPVRR